MIGSHGTIMSACVLVMVAGCKEPREKRLAMQAEQNDIKELQVYNDRPSEPYADFAQPIITTDIKKQYTYGTNVIINLAWKGNPKLMVYKGLLNVSYRLRAGSKVLATGDFDLQDGLIIGNTVLPLGKVECGVLAPGKYSLEIITVARLGVRDSARHTRIMNLAFMVLPAAVQINTAQESHRSGKGIDGKYQHSTNSTSEVKNKDIFGLSKATGFTNNVILLDEIGRQSDCYISPINCHNRNIAWVLGKVQKEKRSRFSKRNIRYVLFLRDQRVVASPAIRKLSDYDLDYIASTNGNLLSIGSLSFKYTGGHYFESYLNKLGYCTLWDSRSDDELVIIVGPPEIIGTPFPWKRAVYKTKKESPTLSLLPTTLPETGAGAAYDPKTGLLTIILPSDSNVFDQLAKHPELEELHSTMHYISVATNYKLEKVQIENGASKRGENR